MLSRGMRDKPIEISQGFLGILSVAVLSPSPKMGEGGRRGYGYTKGTAKHGSLPEFLYQRHPEVGDQVAGHMWLIDSTFQ